MKSIALFLLLITATQGSYSQSLPNKKQSYRIITIQNPLSLTRKNETITLSGERIREAFPNQEVKFVQVKDLKSKHFLITQSIDYNNDGVIDEYLFQSNFRPNEEKEFALSLTKRELVKPSKVYASFMPSKEGMEDFAWENDFIGYRFYGKDRAKKQGTGIAMDIWCKRVPELLTNKWYKPSQSYHVDTGYGADHYNSGKNQGCGGSGIFINDAIYFSKPFSSWKIIANGPIRVVFELKFTGWSLNDAIVETKRVTLDAGQYFNKMESSYSPVIFSQDYLHAVGFVQRDDSETNIEKDKGWFASWESLGKGNGDLGTGFIASPDDISKIKTLNNHLVALMHPKPEIGITYYTGAAWSEFGDINSTEKWESFMENQSACIFNPCIVSLK